MAVFTPTATATSSDQAGYTVDNLADSVISVDSGWRWAAASASVPVWVRYDLGTAKVATYYWVAPGLFASSQDPTAWTLEGSNDASSWTTLDTRSSVSFGNQSKRYTFTNSTAYRYYRLNITANGGGVTSLSEWQVGDLTGTDRTFENAEAAGAITVSADTSSYNLGLLHTFLSDGNVTHLRYYETSAMNGTVTLRLYNSAGTILASVTHTAVTGASGVREVALAAPYAVTAGTTLMAAVQTPGGFANWTPGTTASSYDTWYGNIKIPANATVTFGGSNATARYISPGSATMPNSAFGTPMYAVGVTFAIPSSGTSLDSPTATATAAATAATLALSAVLLTSPVAGATAAANPGTLTTAALPLTSPAATATASTSPAALAFGALGLTSPTATATAAASPASVGAVALPLTSPTAAAAASADPAALTFGTLGLTSPTAASSAAATPGTLFIGSVLALTSPAAEATAAAAPADLLGILNVDRAIVSTTYTPVGILSAIPLLPVTPLADAVPITRVSVLAPNLSAAYPQHPAPGEPGAPDVIEEVVGYPQLFIGGRNVTNLRDAPTIIRRWESEAPFGDTVAAFEFPQLNPWDKPGTGDLDFMARDARVAIGLREEVAPGAFRVRRLWSGFLDARGNGLGEGEDYAWEAKGTFWQAASYVREPHPITEPVDIGVWIARVMNAIEGRRWSTMPLTPIGITTMTRGHRDQTGWDYIQELLSEAITDDFRQWTLMEVAPGVPRLVLKPAPTEVHATVAYGTPGVDVDLRVDESTRVDRIFMRGIGPKMGGWANVYYPWMYMLTQAPPYPMASLTDYIVLGTTDADTVTGAGVTDFQRRVDELEGFSNPAVSGTMTAAWMAVVDDLQRRLHITVGPLGPQTWERVFDDRPNPEALKPRRLPMASKIEAEKYLYDAGGKRLPGVNPAWDGRVPRDVAIDIGVGKTKAEGFKLARKLLGMFGEPAANGQIVWTTDPREIDRTRLSHLSNIKVTGFEGEDRVVQVSSKSVEYDTGGDGPLYVVTTRVDERARDAMVVEDLLNQRREAKADPSRRPGVTNRASRQVSDQRTPWDSESICGRVPRTAVNGASGLWTVKWIPFAEVGKLASIELHATQPFAFAIFASLRITENKLASRGNPFDSADFWRDNKDYFDQFGIIEAWGEQGDACGYSPKSEADGGSFTGDFILDTPVDYWTESPPAVAVAFFMRGGSGHVWGRFVPAYES